MTLKFEKYQGTGNDFIMIDQRNEKFIDLNNNKLIAKICDRRFGVGADGLIILENSANFDFKMIYFNADGNESSMCGNGGRCIVRYAFQLGIFDIETNFEAIDGPHIGKIQNDGNVSLKMANVQSIKIIDAKTFELNTGSPHYITFKDTIPLDIKSEGAAIRYSEKYNTDGINVNFVRYNNDKLEVATYERGVEDETLSCGTGVTAAALAYAHQNNLNTQVKVNIVTKGGDLIVNCHKNETGVWENIWLTGPAEKVFSGRINI